MSVRRPPGLLAAPRWACSECGASWEKADRTRQRRSLPSLGVHAKTCSPECGRVRARRLWRAKYNNAYWRRIQARARRRRAGGRSSSCSPPTSCSPASPPWSRRPGVHGVRCHGVFAPNAKARLRVVPWPLGCWGRSPQPHRPGRTPPPRPRRKASRHRSPTGRRAATASRGPTSSRRSSPWTSSPAPAAAGSSSSPSSPRRQWPSAPSSAWVSGPRLPAQSTASRRGRRVRAARERRSRRATVVERQRSEDVTDCATDACEPPGVRCRRAARASRWRARTAPEGEAPGRLTPPARAGPAAALAPALPRAVPRPGPGERPP